MLGEPYVYNIDLSNTSAVVQVRTAPVAALLLRGPFTRQRQNSSKTCEEEKKKNPYTVILCHILF